jgi:hypothetical protein
MGRLYTSGSPGNERHQHNVDSQKNFNREDASQNNERQDPQSPLDLRSIDSFVI